MKPNRTAGGGMRILAVLFYLAGVGTMMVPFWYWFTHPWRSEMWMLLHFWAYWLACIIFVLAGVLVLVVKDSGSTGR